MLSAIKERVIIRQNVYVLIRLGMSHGKATVSYQIPDRPNVRGSEKASLSSAYDLVIK